MNDNYYLDNSPFEYYKVKATDATTSMDDKLERKTPIITDWPDQHGLRRDYSESFYKERVFTIGVACFSEVMYDEFFAALTVSRPVRITRESCCGNIKSFDVYLSSPNRAGTWKGIPFYDHLEFVEDMPIKMVYKCDTTSAQIHIESEHSLQISWGDQTFKNDVFTGDISHEYTDDYKSHYIIVSGRVSEAIIETDMFLVEKVLC